MLSAQEPLATDDEYVEDESGLYIIDDNGDSLSDYAQLFGNEDAASATREEEIARRTKILGQLGRTETHNEHDWAIIDGDYDTPYGMDPFFNPDQEGVAYSTPPESVRRLIAEQRD